MFYSLLHFILLINNKASILGCKNYSALQTVVSEGANCFVSEIEPSETKLLYNIQHNIRLLSKPYLIHAHGL